MIPIIGGFVGFVGVRFWWKGAATLLALAVSLSAIATAVIYSDRDAYPFEMSPQSFLWTVGHQLELLALGYAIGFAGYWALGRLSASRNGAAQANAAVPQMSMQTFLWIRPLVFAGLFTAALAAISFPQANTSDPLELLKRVIVLFLGSYGMFVLVALLRWKGAKPVSPGDRIP